MAKYHDEEWLEERLENNTPQEVADECGVQKGTIFKWRKKLGVGETYNCEYCEEEFPTDRGLNIHKSKEHDDQSGKGSFFTCKFCGERNWTPRVNEDDPKYPQYCSRSENEKGCYSKSISGEDNPNKDPERKKKISQTMKEVHREGRGNYGVRDREWMMENVINERDDEYLHQEPSEETKKKLSKTQKEIVERGEHHFQDPEVREQIVETRNENGTWEWYSDISPEEAQKRSVEARENYGPKIIEVEETGNVVDSTWEAEVDRLLHRKDVNYFYNDGDDINKYNLSEYNYVPDFIIPTLDKDIVIEVKGWLGYGYNKEKSELCAEEMTEREDVHYIVYGDVGLECDEFVEYENEEGLIQTVNELLI